MRFQANDPSNTTELLRPLRDYKNHSFEKNMKRFRWSWLMVLALLGQLMFPVTGWAADIHTAFDNIPDFAANPTLRSASNGPWSSPATWTPARVPAASDIVRITHMVTYDSTTGDADVIGVDAGGALRFSTTQTTRLRVGTLLILPNGALEAGTSSNPIPSSFTAEIIIKNKALNTTTDPDQYGTGLLAVDGKVTMHGAVKSPTFVRLAAEPLAGQSTLQLQQAVAGWQVGDRIAIPDTRHLKQGSGEVWSGYVPQWEEFTISNISGSTITLNRPLSYDHVGARDGNNNLDFLPHVMNLTRNIKIRSENPSGTRGHTLYTRTSDIDIRYVEHKELGRTTNADLGPGNHIGRYSLHMHHVYGPINPTNSGYQFRIVGNAIADSLKWPMTVHDSHYGLVQDNVVYNGSGAGIVTEDGSESYNEFVHNFVMAIDGNISPRQNDGRDGSCFWFAGFNHRVRDSVASNCIGRSQGIVAGSGYSFWWRAASTTSTRIPLYRGADTANGQEGIEYQLVNMQFIPIPEFARNEAYGATATGMVIWNLGTSGYEMANMAETLIKDFVGWHLWEEGFYGYPINRVTFDGFIVRGSSRAFGIFDYGVAWQSGDYKASNIIIRNANIQGMQKGICCSTDTPGTFTIENSYFRTYSDAITIQTQATPGTRAQTTDRQTIISNVQFVAWPGQSLRSVNMYWNTIQGNTDTTSKDEVFVYNYQGQSGNNFRVYYLEQATQNIVGGLAPCNGTTTHPEIYGITCPITGGTTSPPPAPSGLVLR